MTRQDFRAARPTADHIVSFVKYLLKNGLLLKSIDIIWSFRSDKQILRIFVQDVMAMRRLWKLLVMLARSPILHLL